MAQNARDVFEKAYHVKRAEKSLFQPGGSKSLPKLLDIYPTSYRGMKRTSSRKSRNEMYTNFGSRI